MTLEYDISVVLATYNRCELLGQALRSILSQDAGEVRYEVIVVDNNSVDRTREVVEFFVRRGARNLRYLLETRPGVSYVRNTGIANARSNMVAFFDDDVTVSSDWISLIHHTFLAHPEIDCVGGRVLPRWETNPPAWLNRDHWAPVALQDYGDAPMYIGENNPLCLLSANLAFRKPALERIGLFLPELQRVGDGIGSMEDAELLIRLWRGGGRALFIPSLIAEAYVPADRMTRSYHRRWHLGNGRFHALLRLDEIEQSRTGRLFDVPAHLYREALTNAWRLVRSWLKGDVTSAFKYETRLCFFWGYFRERRAGLHGSHRGHATGEIIALAKTLFRKLRRA